jgi:hypothetical protein
MRHLEWDSEFFGLPIARADLPDDDAREAIAAARAEDVECLYVFAPGDRLDLVHDAVAAGARPLEIRSDLDREAEAPPGAQPGIRRATTDDLEQLDALAEDFSLASRFRLDPRFPQERIAPMYRRWIRRCFDEGVVVVPADGAGGLVGVRMVDGIAWVDLIYVAAAARGGGVAGRLVLAGIDAAGATRARTTTQATNLPVQRMLQGIGFRTATVSVVLHIWPQDLQSAPRPE